MLGLKENGEWKSGKAEEIKHICEEETESTQSVRTPDSK